MPSHDINEIFTQNLKDLLSQKDMKYSELASILGIGKSTISMWMSSKSLPRMEMLDKIADIFGVSAGYLTTDHSTANDTGYKPQTLAAHFDGDEFTEEELEEIRQFAAFVKSRRN